MTEELKQKLFEAYEKMKSLPVLSDGTYLVNVEGTIYRITVEAGTITESIEEKMEEI